MGFAPFLSRLSLAYLRNKSAAAGTVFITAVNRDAKTAFGTGAQADAFLYKDVSRQNRGHTHDGDNKQHVVQAGRL